MRRILVALVGLAAIGHGSWILLFPTTVLRYRFTLEVETPEGIKSGSSVIESRFELLPTVLGARYSRFLTKGQAAEVDLGQRGKLFMTLHASLGGGEPFRDPATLIYKVFPGIKRGSDGGSPREEIRQLSTLTGRAQIPFNYLPMLVRFRETIDPSTIELVEPNLLAEKFGEGVRLLKATLEFTKDPLTTGIEKSLAPWFEEYDARQLKFNGDDRPFTNTAELAGRLSTGIFKRNK